MISSEERRKRMLAERATLHRALESLQSEVPTFAALLYQMQFVPDALAKILIEIGSNNSVSSTEDVQSGSQFLEHSPAEANGPVGFRLETVHDPSNDVGVITQLQFSMELSDQYFVISFPYSLDRQRLAFQKDKLSLQEWAQEMRPLFSLYASEGDTNEEHLAAFLRGDLVQEREFLARFMPLFRIMLQTVTEYLATYRDRR